MLVTLIFVLLANQPAADIQEKRIVVDLEHQTLTCFQGMEQVMQFDVSTGKPGLDTPTGTVRVQAKKPVMIGIDGKRYKFAIQIHMYDERMKMRRRINIHESKNVPDHRASSGCVRVLTGLGRKVYEWVEVGTPVDIIDGQSGCLL